MSDLSSTPLPPPQARFTDLGDGTLSELMAKQTQLFYEPATGAARATFNGMPYLNIAGKYRELVALGDILEVDFSSQMTRQYANEVPFAILDPVTGVDLADVSVAGMMVLIKVAYDLEVNAREAKRLAKLVVAQATALAATAVESPAPNGTISRFLATAPNITVTFTDQSVGGLGISIVKRTWIFGDEFGTSNAKSPVYKYPAPGTYQATLIVTDSMGISVKSTQTIIIPV